MKFTKTYIFLLVLNLLAIHTFAQDSETRKAVLIDKFTRGNCEEVLMRMDNFSLALQNDPNSQGQVITYGKPKQRAIAVKEMKNWIRIKRFDDYRIIFTEGGGGEKAEIELWRVPAGAERPEIKSQPESSEISSDAEKMITNPTGPYIFSSEYYDGVGGCGNDGELDLEGYAKMLKETPKSRGNIVIMLTSKTEFRKKEKEILTYLTKRGIARKRLKTFYVNSFGGVELWLLP